MENMHTDVRLYSEPGSLSCTFRKATSVKKEESSKAKKSRRPISFKTQVRKWCLIIEGTPYLLCEGWLGDFVFTGIMISIFYSWILIKDDIILPFPSEQFFLYLNTNHEWRIKWLQCDWQTILMNDEWIWFDW